MACDVAAVIGEPRFSFKDEIDPACKWTRAELTGYWLMTKNVTQAASDVVFDAFLRDGLIVPVDE